MVMKLLKHEFIALTRRLFPFEIVVLCAAVLTRCIRFFDGAGSRVVYNICLISSVIALCIAAAVLAIGTVFVCVSRFYKNMFSREGYLTFTLPVTAGQHLFVKLFSATAYSLISLLVILVSAWIATLGELSNEILKCVIFLLKKYFSFFSRQPAGYWINGIAYLVEAVLIVIAGIVTGYLLYYTCICIGQLANKNRILAAIGVYFAYYFIKQILGTVFVAFSAIGVFVGVAESISRFAENHIYWFVHIAFIGALLVLCFLGGIYLLICRGIMRNKLNLE